MGTGRLIASKRHNGVDLVRCHSSLYQKGEFARPSIILLEERGTAMANFVLLYSGGGMPESEAEQAAVIKAWGAWYGRLGSTVVEGGNPFTTQAKRIASDGTE